MKSKDAMHLKALMNSKTKAAGVSPQLMLQNYMLERLTDRDLSVWLASWWRYRLKPSTALSEMGGWGKSPPPSH